MSHCAQCGAALPGDRSCRQEFEELLRREYRMEFGEEAWRVHGLAVSSYILQHPREFDLRSFVRARLTLEMVVNDGLEPEQVERRVSRGSVSPTVAAEYIEEYETLRSREDAVEYGLTVAEVLREDQNHEQAVMQWSGSALEGHYAALGTDGAS